MDMIPKTLPEMLKLEQDCRELERQCYSMEQWASNNSCDLGMTIKDQDEIDNHWTRHVGKVAKETLDKVHALQERYGLKSILEDRRSWEDESAESYKNETFKIYEELGIVVINEYAMRKIKVKTDDK